MAKIIPYSGSAVFAIDLTDFTPATQLACQNCQRKNLPSYFGTSLYAFRTHMAVHHHTPVMVDNDTVETATERFIKENPEVVTCEDCINKKAPWTRTQKQAHH